jgi:3-oxoacyl-[acyl-carrier protein] reductase
VLGITGHNQSHISVIRAEATVGIQSFDDDGATSVAHNSTTIPEPAVVPEPTVQVPSVDSTATDWGKSKDTRPILVTGGSRGIGKSIALQLGREGYPVAVAYRRSAHEAELVVADIKSTGGRAMPICMDMEYPQELNSSMEIMKETLGSPLGLIHCASPELDHTPSAEVSIETMERFWNVYVTSCLVLTQQMMGAQQQHGWGRFVFMGTSFIIGAPPVNTLAYVTTKSALWGLTKGLSVELGRCGTTVNMVSPSMTMTDLSRHVPRRSQLSEAQRTPLRRLAEPEDTAQVVSFLLSDAAAYLTGIQMPVSGGSAIL